MVNVVDLIWLFSAEYHPQGRHKISGYDGVIGSHRLRQPDMRCIRTLLVSVAERIGFGSLTTQAGGPRKVRV